MPGSGRTWGPKGTERGPLEETRARDLERRGEDLRKWGTLREDSGGPRLEKEGEDRGGESLREESGPVGELGAEGRCTEI